MNTFENTLEMLATEFLEAKTNEEREVVKEKITLIQALNADLSGDKRIKAKQVKSVARPTIEQCDIVPIAVGATIEYIYKIYPDKFVAGTKPLAEIVLVGELQGATTKSSNNRKSNFLAIKVLSGHQESLGRFEENKTYAFDLNKLNIVKIS